MPVDNTRIIPTRRTQKHITEEELRDIELKRLRGELSCAECRRLKLKCDKKVPCGSCVRRGCESICPCGILSAGQGTRFILASTDQLHRKITEMSHRIRQLEDALAILQSSVSETRHPLLTDDLLKIKFGSEALGPKPEDNKVDGGDGGEGGGIDALGTLTLDESGEVKYFGRSAGSETLMMANDESPLPEQTEPTIPLTPHLENLANLFPFTTKHRRNSSSLEQLESLLPSHERAVQLCELYIDHATLFFRPIKRDELLGRLLPSVYETAAQRIKNRITTTADSPSSDFSSPSPSSHSSDEEIDNTTPHTLASLFFILALGALFDLNLGAFNAEAEHFYNLGRAAMSLRTVFDSPSLATVRALGLMACYCSLGGWKCSRDSAWCIMSFAAKVAQSIGLHRDSARWNMDPETVQIRRNLFWEVFASDVSHSLAIGRPPALHLSYVDCELATDDEATLSDTGETQNGFWRMKHIFARDIFTSVAEATLGAKSPSYSTILELDRKVREISFPVHFRPYVSRAEGDALFYSSSASLKAFYASIHRTVTMLYLHRSFFAQAMLDHPANPLLSPFASSFLTAYRCASVIIKASAHQFDRCAEIGMRVWFLLYHTFSAAVIAGTIVTRSSNSSVAPSALIDLDLAVKLFERASIKSQRAKIALGVLRKLGEKAHRAFSQFTSQSTSGLKSQNNILGIFSSQAIDDVEDELAIFGGHTRVLDRKKHRHTQSSSTSSASSPQADGSISPKSEPVKQELGLLGDISQVHPSLVDYLNSTRSLKREGQGQLQVGGGYTQGQVQGQQYQTATQLAAFGTPDRRDGGGSASFSSYSDYSVPGSISASNSTSSIGSSGNGMYASLPQQQQQQGYGWSQSTPTSETPVDQGQFSWSGAAGIVQQAQAQHPMQSQTAYSYNEGMNPLWISPSTPQQQQQQGQGQGQFGGGYGGYNTSYSSDYGLNPAAPTTAMGGIVEMGLTTESRLDAGWVSFMRDCGIMEGDKSA